MSSRLQKPTTRREMLRLLGLGVAGTALVACATPTPQVIKETVVVEKIATQIVEKQVEKQVEKVVTATPPISALSRLEGKKGRLWGLQYDPHVLAYQRLAYLFNKLTGATLNVEPQAWPIETKLLAALAAGTQPDAACIMGKMCLPLYVQNALLPLRDAVYNYMKVKPEDVFFEDAVQAYSWKGEMYGVPTEAGGLGNVVNVPVDDVQKLGLADKYPPTDGRTWWKDYPEMFELAKALQIEKEGRVERWGLSSKGWDASSVLGMVRSLLAERGTDWWDLGATKFNMTTDEAIQAMKWFAEDPVNLGIETELAEGSVDGALAGKCALARGNQTPSRTDTSKLGYNFDVCGVPMCVPNKPPLSCSEAGWGFVAPKATKNPDISIEFMRMMVTEDGQREYDKIYGGQALMAWKGFVGVYDHWEDTGPKAIRWAKLAQEKLMPLARYYGEALGYYGEVDRIIAEVASNVRMKKYNSKEACQDIQNQLEAQYKQWLEDIKQLT